MATTTAAEPTPRVPSRNKRQRKARDKRFAELARRAKPANGKPSCILADPDFYLARAVGLDVTRKELRRPAPPRCPYYDPAETLRNADGSEVVLASAECAAWRWWKSLDANERHAFYEITVSGDPPTGVVVLNMGLEISNPQFVVERW